MAYAAAEFAASCLRALDGEPDVVECAYVESHLTELPFFASPVRLGRNGVEARARPAVPPCRYGVLLVSFLRLGYIVHGHIYTYLHGCWALCQHPEVLLACASMS